MRNVMAVALMTAIILLVGCGSEKAAEKSTSSEPPIKTITRAEADEKLKQLSTVLDVRYDDMKEVTFCRCPINDDIHPPIYIIPYVVVDKEYHVSLRQDILYVGREVLDFDKLYIKTPGGVDIFHYEKTVKSFDKGYVGEEYVGQMTGGLYQKLKTAIKEGGAKFRLEGRTFGERELTEEELVDMEELFSVYEFFKGVKVVK